MNHLLPRRFRLPLAALLSVICACNSATNSYYRGQPLLTLGGQMTVPPNTSFAKPVRIALIWYNTEGDSTTPHPSIFAQDFLFHGTFPTSDYTFEIYQPPPPDALVGTGAGGTGAVGILVAYEDLNGNGKLDPIPLDGHPVDKILGTSLGDAHAQSCQVFDAQGFDGGEQCHPYSFNAGVVVMYIAGAPDSVAQSVGAMSGFNLLRVSYQGSPPFSSLLFPSTQEIVPLSTFISINLTSHWANDFLACDDSLAHGPLSGYWPCGLTPPADVLTVSGQIYATNAGSLASFSVRDALNQGLVSVAQITVNNRIIPLQTSTGKYVLEDSQPFINPGSSNAISVRTPGFRNLDLSVTEVPAFQITAPPANALVHAGTSLDIAWTDSGSADCNSFCGYYQAALLGESGQYFQLGTFGPPMFAFKSVPINYLGAATLQVTQFGNWITTPDGSSIVPAFVYKTPLQFVP